MCLNLGSALDRSSTTVISPGNAEGCACGDDWPLCRLRSGLPFTAAEFLYRRGQAQFADEPLIRGGVGNALQRRECFVFRKMFLLGAHVHNSKRVTRINTGLVNVYKIVTDLVLCQKL